MAHLDATTADKIAIANPKWNDLRFTEPLTVAGIAARA
jgi:hypothetical protein